MTSVPQQMLSAGGASGYIRSLRPMEIPPEDRPAAREFVGIARQAESVERRMFRSDVVALVALVAAIVINGAMAMAGDAVSVFNVAIVALLSFVAGMKFVRVSDRRETYRTMVESANEVETALAFHDLDDAS